MFLLSGYMNLSAEFIDSFKLLRSLNYYNEPGISGVTTLTSSPKVGIAIRMMAMKAK